MTAGVRRDSLEFSLSEWLRSTMTDSTHALHQRGDHSLCDYQRCEERQAEEAANREAMYAVAVLAAIRKRGGVPGEVLGDSYQQYAELARTEQPEYLPQRPGPAELIRANMEVRECMAGIPTIWAIAEFDTAEDDFDVDKFLDSLN